MAVLLSYKREINMRLMDKAVIVTGGARGMGRAYSIAHAALARYGIHAARDAPWTR